MAEASSLEKLRELASNFQSVYNTDWNLAHLLSRRHAGTNVVQFPFFGGYTYSEHWYQLIMPEATLEEAEKLANVNRILIGCIDHRLSAQFLADLGYQSRGTDLAIMVAGGAAQHGNEYRFQSMAKLVKGILKFAPVHALIAGVHTGVCAMVDQNTGGSLSQDVANNGGSDAPFERDLLHSMAMRLVNEVTTGWGAVKPKNTKIAIAHVGPDDKYEGTTTHSV